MEKVDVIIIGAGAAGLMCGIESGKRRKTLILDHANKVGKKILMSGGGRCNFTNLNISPERYISHNPHFPKSALSRYTQWDFVNLVKKRGIPYHEKTLGQLFCDNKSSDIVSLLFNELNQSHVEIRLNTTINSIEKISDYHFTVHTNKGIFHCQSLVIATGGLSIPTMGATPFAYKIAEQFNIPVWPTRPGLVPLTLHSQDKEKYATLSGIALDCEVSVPGMSFREKLLFTHRGLSGPAILQISSYWSPGETLEVFLLPSIQFKELILQAKEQKSQKKLKVFLGDYFPKRFIEIIFPHDLIDKKIASLSADDMRQLLTMIQQWKIKPNATEGYRTAEVTLGGVDCNALSSKTMEVRTIPGLYFVGEAVDVSGWLGGYNFQWAWSSGWAAGTAV